MPGNYMESIKKARADAGLTQEQAAEAVDVSLESWKAYEYGLRVPPVAVAIRICEAMDAPWFALEHLRQVGGPLGVLPERITVQALPTAAITLINRVLDFAEHHRDRQLLRIAEDGVIDDTERPEFEDIVRDLDGIVGAALQVKYTSTKKDRPVAGTTKRSVQGLASENDCKTIVSHRAGISSPNFCRGGGASL